MLPLDGLWLNASKPEPSLDVYMGNQTPNESIGPRLASCEWLHFKFTSRFEVSLPGLYEAEWTSGRKA